MTLEEAKLLIGTTSTSKDNYYLSMLPIVEDYIENYCNDNFLVQTSWGSTSYAKDYPEGIKLYIAKKLTSYEQESGIMSESIGDYSVTFGSEDPLNNYLKPYRKVGFV